MEIVAAIPEGIAGEADIFAVEMAVRLLSKFRTDKKLALPAAKMSLLMALLSRLGLDPQGRTRLLPSGGGVRKKPDKPTSTLGRYMESVKSNGGSAKVQ